MNRTTRSARTPFLRTGFFAALRGGGSGAGFMGGTAVLRLSGLLALAVAALLVLGAASASALTTRQLQTQITGFTAPSGLSVDPSDDLWVTDPGNAGLVTELSPYPANAKIGEQDGEGHFTFGGEYIESAATGPNGKLYVGDSGAEVVHVFKPSGEWEETWTGFSGFVHVAVDTSATAGAGTVYATETSGVKAFTPTGEPQAFTAAGAYIEGNKLTG